MNILLSKVHSLIGYRYLITITYYSEYFKNGKTRRYKYVTKIMINRNSSVREIAKMVIESSIKEYPNWIEVVRNNQPISIYLDGRNNDEIKKTPLGICYDITENGSIKFLNDDDLLLHDWTYGKIIKLHKAGYISGDVSHLIIETPYGIGASGSIDFSKLIGDMLMFIGLLANIESALQIKDRIINRIRYKKLVNSFKSNNLYRLKQIRQLLETNKEWRLKKVMKALSVNRNDAILILKKLGYIYKNSKWFFDDASINSLELRKKWLMREEVEVKEIDKKTEEWLSE